MTLILFIIGICIGSFLNVLIDRIPRREKITGRSYCENCKKQLKWKDLIPLVSFFYLRGKCRYCHAPLSYQYPVGEFLTGLLFGLTYLLIINKFTIYDLSAGEAGLQFTIELLYYLFNVSVLIVVFFIDLKYGIIPDRIIFPAIVVSVLYIFVLHPSSLILYLVSAFGAFAFFLFLYLVTKGRGIGFGDVKLSFLLGLFLGFPLVIVSLYLAFLTGAIFGIILILWRKKNLSSPIPFGPFLASSSLLTIFLGNLVLSKILQDLLLLSF